MPDDGTMIAPTRIIRIAAAVIRDDDGRLLLVRKRGTTAFMQAGGKIEPGETARAALARELREELGFVLPEGAARYRGRYRAPAANEPDHIVEAELFDLLASGPFDPAAEIEEMRWFGPGESDSIDLAPLTRDHVLVTQRNGFDHG